MKTLFIDTHYQDLVIGLYDSGNLVKLNKLEKVKSTSECTLNAIINTLEECHWKIQEVEKMIVCNGPGSFTGTRIGVTIGKVLAYSLNIPIYSIDSITLKALGNKGECYFGVRENNGCFVAKYQDEKRVGSIFYLKKNEISIFEFPIIIDKECDYGCLLKTSLLVKEDCFSIKPIYVKSIEALK